MNTLFKFNFTWKMLILCDDDDDDENPVQNVEFSILFKIRAQV